MTKIHGKKVYGIRSNPQNITELVAFSGKQEFTYTIAIIKEKCKFKNIILYKYHDKT
jgi:hypothetical protein